MTEETLKSYLTMLAQNGVERLSQMSREMRVTAGCLAMDEDEELYNDVVTNDANLRAFLTCQYGQRAGDAPYVPPHLCEALGVAMDRAIITGTKGIVSDALDAVLRELNEFYDLGFDGEAA